MVFIAVQNLVEIVVVLKICEFQYCASLAWKCPFTPLLGGSFGGKNRGNGKLSAVLFF